MSGLAGRWALRVRTPVGSIHARMHFHDDGGGLRGSATGAGETVELRDIRLENRPDGQHASWTQRINRPLPLTLHFDVVLDGDVMRGESRAGRLPRSSVAGSRLPPHAPPGETPSATTEPR